MKKLLVLVVMLAASASASGQRGLRTDSSQFEAREGGRVARVEVITEPFSPSKHRVVLPGGGSSVTTVDGREAFGVDGTVPSVRISSLKFFFDGKAVAVPRELYSDCYNPNTRKDSLRVKIGDDLQSAFVFMTGGDGAGVYDVIWVLRKDARHSRFASAGGDCHLLNLYCGRLGN